jgi:hypothetical protein
MKGIDEELEPSSLDVRFRKTSWDDTGIVGSMYSGYFYGVRRIYLEKASMAYS